MSEKKIVRVIPRDGPRVETGAVQIGADDWPGLFIRGDNAGWLALNVGFVLDAIKAGEAPDPMAVAQLEDLLRMIQGDVIV